MSPRQAMACVITAGAMWGTISIFVRHLDSMGLSAMQICFVRTLVALVVLFLALALFRKELLCISITDCPILFVQALSATLSLERPIFVRLDRGSSRCSSIAIYIAYICHDFFYFAFPRVIDKMEDRRPVLYVHRLRPRIRRLVGLVDTSLICYCYRSCSRLLLQHVFHL